MVPLILRVTVLHTLCRGLRVTNRVTANIDLLAPPILPTIP